MHITDMCKTNKNWFNLRKNMSKKGGVAYNWYVQKIGLKFIQFGKKVYKNKKVWGAHHLYVQNR